MARFPLWGRRPPVDQRAVVGKTALSSSLVPLPLALSVSFRPCGIVLKQLRPVARVFRAPLLRALQTSLSIHRIVGDLPSVVIVTAPSLTDRVTTSTLSRLKLGRHKCSLAIAAGPFSHEPVLACRRAPLPRCSDVQATNLETDVECVPRPRQWVCSFELQNRRKCCCFIPALTDCGESRA